MWGRYEGKRKYGIAVFAVILFLCAGPMECRGQELSDNIVRLLEAESESGGRNTEALMEYFQSLLDNPLDINKASEAELEKMTILSRFQIVSLLEYRKEFGDVLTLSELSLIDGFNENIVRDIAPFIKLKYEGNIGGYVRKKRLKNSFILRGKTTVEKEDEDYPGPPVYRYFRYRLDYADKVRFGTTMENDVGEGWHPDFISAHFQLKNVKFSEGVVLKSAVVGDFSARMGQGLVLWNSFSITGLSNPSSVIKRESPIVPYASSDELNFFRGVGVSMEFLKKINLSLFYSYKKVDAKVDSVAYYSLPDGGLHNTQSSLEKRHRLGENVFGANVSYRTEHLKVGLTVAGYCYDKKNMRQVKDYNKYLMYDGWWGNAAIDFYYSWKMVRLFGEVAVDYGGSLAGLVGGAVSFGSSFEISALWRYYSEKYVSTYAGAYASSSSCNNEHGGMVNFKWNCFRSISFSGYADYSFHPWVKYNTPARSQSLRSALLGEWAIDGRSSLDLKCSFSWKNSNTYPRTGMRLKYTFSGKTGVGASSRVEFSANREMGYLVCQNVSYLSRSEKIGIYFGCSAFHVDEWDNRIYCYEKDLPNTFSVPAMYGRGIGSYIVLKYSPFRWLDIIFKGGGTKYFDKPEKDKLSIKLQISLAF